MCTSAAGQLTITRNIGKLEYHVIKSLQSMLCYQSMPSLILECLEASVRRSRVASLAKNGGLVCACRVIFAMHRERRIKRAQRPIIVDVD